MSFLRRNGYKVLKKKALEEKYWKDRQIHHGQIIVNYDEKGRKITWWVFNEILKAPKRKIVEIV